MFMVTKLDTKCCDFKTGGGNFWSSNYSKGSSEIILNPLCFILTIVYFFFCQFLISEASWISSPAAHNQRFLPTMIRSSPRSCPSGYSLSRVGLPLPSNFMCFFNCINFIYLRGEVWYLTELNLPIYKQWNSLHLLRFCFFLLFKFKFHWGLSIKFSSFSLVTVETGPFPYEQVEAGLDFHWSP